METVGITIEELFANEGTIGEASGSCCYADTFEIEEVSAPEVVGEASGSCCYAGSFEIEELAEADPVVGEASGSCCYGASF